MSKDHDRKPVVSVGIKDCDVQVFRAGGKGGQKQNKTSSGVRVIHRPSGARGESREHREQRANKRAAFVRMAESAPFQRWIRVEHARRTGAIEAWVEEQMRPEHIQVEYYDPASATI